MPDNAPNPEQLAGATPPIAPQPAPQPVPSLYDGLRVRLAPFVAAADAATGGALSTGATMAKNLGSQVKDIATDPTQRRDFIHGTLVGMASGTDTGFEGVPEIYSGLRVRKANEVMVQPHAGSSAAPMGESGSLPPEVHTDLEKQAGRELSNNEAIALDRANLERGMVDAPKGQSEQPEGRKYSEVFKTDPTKEKRFRGMSPEELKQTAKFGEPQGQHLTDNPDLALAYSKSPKLASEERPRSGNGAIAEFRKSGPEYKWKWKFSHGAEVDSKGNVTRTVPSNPKDMAEHAGLVYKDEAMKGSGVHQFEHPDHPNETMAVREKDLSTPEDLKARMTAKLAEKPIVPKVTNASGESAASQEAINRLAAEKLGGVKRVRIDTRSGKEIPLIGVDAADAKPGPHDAIVRRDAKGETLLDKGEKARYKKSL